MTRFIGGFLFLGELTEEPRLACQGQFEPPRQLSGNIREHRRRLARNEPHVMAVSLDLPTIGYVTTDYATICAFRDRGWKSWVLGASVLAVCPDLQELIVQRRSPKVHINCGMLHSFSGTYDPRHDEDSLVRTALRELAEESGVDVPANRRAGAMGLFQDDQWGCIELCLMGMAVSADEAGRMADCEEGEVVRIPLDDIDRSLGQDNWCKGGKAEIDAWRNLGMPVGRA